MPLELQHLFKDYDFIIVGVVGMVSVTLAWRVRRIVWGKLEALFGKQ